jgi:hypothetical protein
LFDELSGPRFGVLKGDGIGEIDIETSVREFAYHLSAGTWYSLQGS